MGLEKYFNGDYYIFCICEGTAEQDIMEWLLDEDKLLFTRDNLAVKKTIRRISVKKFQNRYLSWDYDKKLAIIRVIDSKNEKFELDKLYKKIIDKKDILSCYTRPEIEILMAIDMGDYEKCRNFEKKPSDFCMSEYKIEKIKAKNTMKEFFNYDVNRLIKSLKDYKSLRGKSKNDEYAICDLLK